MGEVKEDRVNRRFNISRTSSRLLQRPSMPSRIARRRGNRSAQASRRAIAFILMTGTLVLTLTANLLVQQRYRGAA